MSSLAGNYHLIGRGVYSLVEAERLTGIPTKRIRRWMEGYSFTSKGQRRHSPPIVVSDVGREIGSLALTFADLIEVRFLDRYLEHVSWRTIRIAAEAARKLVKKPHPFSSQIFKTDGRDILVEIAQDTGEKELLNLIRDQWEMQKLVSPMLFADLDFDQFDEAARWWPMTKKRTVVVDPLRSFGAPITTDGGVRTEILAAAARAEGSQRAAAVIYEVPLKAVRHAVEYETRFLA